MAASAIVMRRDEEVGVPGRKKPAPRDGDAPCSQRGDDADDALVRQALQQEDQRCACSARGRQSLAAKKEKILLLRPSCQEEIGWCPRKFGSQEGNVQGYGMMSVLFYTEIVGANDLQTWSRIEIAVQGQKYNAIVY